MTATLSATKYTSQLMHQATLDTENRLPTLGEDQIRQGLITMNVSTS